MGGHSEPTSKTLAGRLLLAAPVPSSDGIFDRSVIFIARHRPEEGAFGIILNRPSGQKVGQLVTEAKLKPLFKLPVYVGGPVEGGQLSFAALWKTGDGGIACVAQISAEDAIERDRQPGTLVRPYLGYSGWAAGQLEDELKRNAWFVVDIPDSLLAMHHDRGLWSETLRLLSPFHRVLAEFPDHPELN